MPDTFLLRDRPINTIPEDHVRWMLHNLSALVISKKCSY
jgi:hypothetical protein